MTGDDIKTAYIAQKGTLLNVDDADYLRWVNRFNNEFYRFFIGTDADRFLTTQTYTISSAPQTSALPTNIRDLSSFGAGVFLADSLGNPTEQQLPITGYGSKRPGFYLQGGNIVFTGITNATVFVRYIPALATLTRLSDTVVVPDEYLQCFVDAIDISYSVDDEDYTGEGAAEQRYTRELQMLLSSLPRTPKVYSIPFLSNV